MRRVQMALGFDDPRVRVEITDGIKWVEDAAEGTYDAIIVDSSDPVGPAEVLFRRVRASHQSFATRKCHCAQHEYLFEKCVASSSVSSGNHMQA